MEASPATGAPPRPRPTGQVTISGTASAFSPVGGPDDVASGVIRFAVILGGILSLSLLALELQRLWLDDGRGHPLGIPTAALLGLVFASLGVAVLARQRRQPAAVLGAGAGLLAGYALLSAWYGAEMLAGPVPVAVRPTWTGVIVLLFALLVAGPPLLHYALLTFSSLAAPFVLAMFIVTGHVGGRHSPPQLARRMIVANSATWICSVVAVAIVVHRERERRRMRAMASQLAAARGELQELGSYQLDRRLGQGNMGEVWQASHRTLARPAAIKLVSAGLLRQLAGSPEQLDRILARYQQEAKLAARLTSAHTVQVFDYGRTDGGQIFYVMELLRGLTLRQVVDRFGRQPPARVVHWLLEVCDSLAEAHSLGLVHRELKPEKLFLTRQGVHREVVKVLDFGLAVVRESLAAAGGAAGRTAESQHCMAPELSCAGAEVDARSDLYSLGCVAWFLLSGQPVFAADSPGALVRAHAELPVPEPPEAAGPGLGQILCELLAKDPEARPGSADALAERLRALALPDPAGPLLDTEVAESEEDFRARPTLVRTRRK